MKIKTISLLLILLLVGCTQQIQKCPVVKECPNVSVENTSMNDSFVVGKVIVDKSVDVVVPKQKIQLAPLMKPKIEVTDEQKNLMNLHLYNLVEVIKPKGWLMADEKRVMAVGVFVTRFKKEDYKLKFKHIKGNSIEKKYIGSNPAYDNWFKSDKVLSGIKGDKLYFPVIVNITKVGKGSQEFEVVVMRKNKEMKFLDTYKTKKFRLSVGE